MRRTLLVSVIVAAVVALGAGFAIPAFAHGGPEGGQTAPANQEDWEAMWEACVNGDWEAMYEWMEETHDTYGGYMPCYGYDRPDREEGSLAPSWRGTGDHMGGGMMGGWGHMMGW